MTVVVGRTKRFEDASPVTRYWLANCVGFSLTGGGRGTVERVITAGDPYTPVQLEIRNGYTVRRLPVSRVAEVVPAEQVIVVRGTDRVAERRAAAGRVATGTGLLLLGAAAWLLRAGKGAARLVASLPWQQYGRSVLSASTRLSREISTTWSRLRTTSSGRSSAKSSSAEARTTSST
jgi:hypothetical protein